MLKQTLDAYLAVRHAAGFELRVPAILLRSFVRFAQDRGHSHVATQTAIEWAAMAPSKAQRHYRLRALIQNHSSMNMSGRSTKSKSSRSSRATDRASAGP